MLVGWAMSLCIYNRAKESMKSTALAVGLKCWPIYRMVKERTECLQLQKDELLRGAQAKIQW